jgi:hypothetical protein
MTPIAPDTPLAVTLSAAQWNQLIFLLDTTPSLPLPHRDVAVLMRAIGEQLQQGAAAIAPAEALGANGHDRPRDG